MRFEMLLFKRIIVPLLSIFILLTKNIFAGCGHELNRYENYKREAENWGKTSILTVGAGSFWGGLGGLVGALPGAVSHRYNVMARNAWDDYRTCLEDEKKDLDRKMEESRRKNKEDKEKRIRENKKKIDDLNI
jgi:hypothetical protein